MDTELFSFDEFCAAMTVVGERIDLSAEDVALTMGYESLKAAYENYCGFVKDKYADA